MSALGEAKRSALGRGMQNHWYCQLGGQVVGPMLEIELCEALRSRQLAASVLVRRSSEEAWRPATDEPTFVAAIVVDSSPSGRHKSRLAMGLGRYWILVVVAAAVVTVWAVTNSVRSDRGRKPKSAESRQDASLVAETGTGDEPVKTHANTGSETEVDRRRRSPKATEDVVEQIRPSIAQILGRDGAGSGFVLRERVVVTNRHVIEGEFTAHLTVRFPLAEGQDHGPFESSVLYVDSYRDLAFLFVDCKQQPLPMAAKERIRFGQQVLAIGNPGAGAVEGDMLLGAVSQGLLSAECRQARDGQRYYQVAMSINPGNSGGPVVNPQGEVIGVVSWLDPTRQGIAFCVPAAEVDMADRAARALSVEEIQRQQTLHELRAAWTVLVRAADSHGRAIAALISALSDVQAGIGSRTELEDALQAVADVVAGDPCQRHELQTQLNASDADRHALGSAKQMLLQMTRDHYAMRKAILSIKSLDDSMRVFQELKELLDRHEEMRRTTARILRITDPSHASERGDGQP